MSARWSIGGSRSKNCPDPAPTRGPGQRIADTGARWRVFKFCLGEERSDEATQLDRHGALPAPRDDKSLIHHSRRQNGEAMTPPKYTFTPRWKEELVCSCEDGEIVIDLTMGIPNVYFYGVATWAKRACLGDAPASGDPGGTRRLVSRQPNPPDDLRRKRGASRSGRPPGRASGGRGAI